MNRPELRQPHTLALALTVALALPAAASESETGAWQLELKSDRHSDSLPLSAFGHDEWARELQPREGRNLSYAEEELRLERRQGDWSLALLARSSATLVASHDSVLLAAQIERGERPSSDTQWSNDVRLRGFSGVGIEAGRRHSLAPGWRAGWSAQALVLTRWRQREVNGPVRYDVASGSYDFALHSRELDNKRQFPFQQPFDARGAGLLFGGELAWEGEQAFAALALRDGGWLRWSGVPEQQMTLDSAVKTFDADGFLIYQPLLQGQNSQAGAARGQPWRATVQTGWKLDAQRQISASAERLPDFGWLPAVQWKQRSGELEWGLGWKLHERRATLSLAWQGWRLRAGTDRLDGSARSRDLALSYTQPL